MARAWAEVSLDAVATNVSTLAEVAAPATVCAVVKADGYGHGATPIARAAVDGGAEWLAVAQVCEATALRRSGIDAPVLLLSEPGPREVEEAIASGAALTAYSDDGVRRLAGAASPADPVAIHLKVDTGMHRVGCSPEEVVALATSIDAAPSLRLEAVWTHCAVADDPDDPFTSVQLERYDAAVAAVEAAGIEVPMRHAANSAAAIAHPRSRYDLVRIGIAVYGIAPAAAVADRVALVPALELATEVASLRRVAPGEGVSYGRRHRVDVETVVATLPVGYADGVSRSLGLLGQDVLIGGERHPMVGAVTMDQVMVDLGPDPAVERGDEAVLLGAQGTARITPEEWAARLGTIAYEVVCALGPRVERRYRGS